MTLPMLDINNIPFAILVVDRDQELVSLNNIAQDLTGYSEEDLVAKPISFLIEELDVDKTQETLALTGESSKSYLLKKSDKSLNSVQIRKEHNETFCYLYLYEPFVKKDEISEPLKVDTRTALESLDEMFWEWDIASDLIYFSAELMALVGYKKEPLQAPRSFLKQHVEKESRQELIRQMQTLLDGESSSYNHTYQILTRDNQQLWVNVTARSMNDGDGVGKRVYGALRNVTETKSLIRQLKKQNSYLSLAERISNSGHWRYDVVAEKMFWSTELYRIFGTEPQSFVPSVDNELSFHTEEERESIKIALQNSINNAQSYYNKSTIIRSNGRKAKIETIGEVEVDSNGNVIALFGICRDVTKSEVIFEKLKLLALVNYTIKVPIFFINEEDNVVYQDLSPQQGDGKTVLFNYINFSISEYLKLKKIAKSKGQLKRINISFDDFNTVFDLSVTYEADEGVYIWIVENVTEKFRKEQQQIISNRLALLGNTFGNVSHDINNVLGVALGAIEMLELKFSQGEQDISRYIDRVKNAIDKGKSVTERLLAFTKKPMVKVVEFDPLKDIVDNQYLFKQMLINTIKLNIELPEQQCTINFPQGEFINILLNLVINSQDAIKEKGLSGTIEIKANYNTDNNLEVHVIDSGIGIQSENLNKIFDPFYSSKSVNKGNGIGLANVYSTIYKHNGQIKVLGKSELGGAHFILEFKCKKLHEPANTGVISSNLLTLKQRRILILDDEESIAEFVALFLETHGAHTFHVSDKKQLINAIEHEGPFDIFMTDMILPDLTGRQATDLVLQHFPYIKVFSMSGYIDNENESWPYPVLRKPFNSNELSEFLAASYR
ncbi:PAS domain S-box protein [Thalassotalea sp. M1531]|uniref:histidine kinase n=1 Tax=Thalassotalea algicola TaxID=2716224 RepID=A0A7Y0Q6P6_9GAMM|nr:PAS domain-containing sensor histidine kinase [Thalassotalea algicola]NMP31386.1 PAS domain S-box protein [Thalassotalea algicola]